MKALEKKSDILLVCESALQRSYRPKASDNKVKNFIFLSNNNSFTMENDVKMIFKV